MNNDNKTLSKFLSLILRHKPETIGLTLDPEGWADVNQLLALLNENGYPLTLEKLSHIVATNDKKRFAFSSDHTRIRASQGHSLDLDLGYPEIQPPPILYHGTADRFLDSILKTGLEKRARHHVHLTESIAIALEVGKRYGKPVLVAIDAATMYKGGHKFFRSENNVWLTNHVPPMYCKFPSMKFQSDFEN